MDVLVARSDGARLIKARLVRSHDLLFLTTYVLLLLIKAAGYELAR